MITKILNVITLSRILCAILIYLILYLESNYSIALFLFFIASFSDFLDGYLARKTNSESVLGEILDPIADKLLIVFVLIGLSINLDSFLLGFISAVIISREIWVAALRDINSRNNQSDKSVTKPVTVTKPVSTKPKATVTTPKPLNSKTIGILKMGANFKDAKSIEKYLLQVSSMLRQC